MLPRVNTRVTQPFYTKTFRQNYYGIFAPIGRILPTRYHRLNVTFQRLLLVKKKKKKNTT